MACPGSFPSSLGEKHPNPTTGREVDLDMLGCMTSCRKGETDPNFQIFRMLFFWILVPDP